MANTRDNAIFISGYLTGVNAPSNVIESARSIIRSFGALEGVPGTDHFPDSTKMVKPAETGAGDHIADASKMVKDVKTIMPLSCVYTPSNDGEKQEVAPEKKPRKPRAPLTEEQKAALRERLIKARAAKMAKQEGAAGVQPTASAAPKKPRQESSPDKLIATQDDYIGVRTDKGLFDNDWGDIQRMRYNGLPNERVARHYGVEQDYLRRFIKRMEEKDKQTEKNF